jgi:proteasome assembly chaperone (PAC2) family protein
MEHVRWSSRPRLRSPIVIAAFAGWNDAGEAASTAARHLADVWATREFATIDPEEFYDFSSTRPQVRLSDGVHREIVWPANEFSASSVLNSDLDVVVLIGTEPQQRWRTFCQEVLSVATDLEARMLITLGALLAEVPHSRSVSVIGTAADGELIDRYGLQRSRYEGPTGIVGVLHDACGTASLASLSLWAAVPAYVQGAPSPKAALALVERVSDVLELAIPTTSLEIASAAYEREVDEVVNNDEDLTGYVNRLEAMVDSGQPFGDDDDDDEEGESADTVDDLVEELERFLRDQRGD